MMRATWTIARREIFSFFVSPIAYIVLTVWMLLHGFSYYMLVGWYAANPSSGGSDTPLSHFFGQTILFYLPLLVFVPMLTMRLMAEERSRGTIEPLLTSPAPNLAIVAGKYLAGLVIWVAMWVPTLLFVWITSQYGDVDLGSVAASYVGVLNIGVYYMAIGLLMSTLGRNQIAAAMMTFVILGMLFMVGMLRFVVPEGGAIFEYVSVWDHMGTASKGILDSRNLVYGVTVAGLALFLTARAVARFRSPGQRGEILHGVIASVLLLSIVGMLNYVSQRHYERWDWTANQRYTLSERSEEVLASLEDPIDIHLFISPSEQNFEDVRELLRSYTANSSLVTVNEVDPHRDPTGYRMLLERYGIRTATLGGDTQITDIAAVVAAGEQSWRITRDDIVSVDFGAIQAGSAQVDVKAERAFTGAIIEATTGTPTQLCVTEGHGEWSTEASEGRTLSPFREELRRENVEMRTIRTLGLEAIPNECDVVLIVGPRTTFGDSEAGLLRDYLRDGGKLLLALDPVLDGERIRPTGLEEVTREAGIRVEPSVVFETSSELQLAGSVGAIGPYALIDYGEHALTANLPPGSPSVFFEARSLSLLPEGGATALASTSAGAFARHEGLNPDMPADAVEGDDDGPIILAAAGEVPVASTGDEEEPESPGRIVVFGDSDWMQGELMHNPQMVNLDLANAAVGWLSDRDALIAIAPRSESLVAIVMSEEDVTNVFWRVVVMIPVAFMLLGFSVWWSRRY